MSNNNQNNEFNHMEIQKSSSNNQKNEINQMVIQGGTSDLNENQGCWSKKSRYAKCNIIIAIIIWNIDLVCLIFGSVRSLTCANYDSACFPQVISIILFIIFFIVGITLTTIAIIGACGMCPCLQSSSSNTTIVVGIKI